MGLIKFLYNSKLDFTAKSLVTNTVIITRVLCILLVLNCLIFWDSNILMVQCFHSKCILSDNIADGSYWLLNQCKSILYVIGSIFRCNLPFLRKYHINWCTVTCCFILKSATVNIILIHKHHNNWLAFKLSKHTWYCLMCQLVLKYML